MIRRAQADDVRELAELWARAFPGVRAVAHRMAALETGGMYGGVETAWIAEESGRAVGAFRGYALTQHLHGAALGMLGLAAVAVEEGSRRRGVGRRLCEAAIRTGRERGDVVSMLYPFRPSYYEALGWGSVGALHSFRFRAGALRRYGGGGEVRKAGHGDTAGIAAVYDRFAGEANGLISRTQRVWRHHLESDGVRVHVTGDSAVRGYAIVHYGTAAGGVAPLVHVRELLADDHRWYEALLDGIAWPESGVVVYDASPDEHFAHRLHDARHPDLATHRQGWAPTAGLIAGPMLRLLDVAGALEARQRWGPSAPLRFGLEVRDAIVPENDGAFVVDFDGRQARVSRGDARPLLRLPVSVLGQVYAGELRVSDALMLGRGEADGDVSAVDALFRTDRCFRLLDEF